MMTQIVGSGGRVSLGISFSLSHDCKESRKFAGGVKPPGGNGEASSVLFCYLACAAGQVLRQYQMCFFEVVLCLICLPSDFHSVAVLFIT